MGLADDLQAFINKPEDLSVLPTILASARELETTHAELNTKFIETESMYQERLSKAQEYSRNLLSQVPTIQEGTKTPESQLPTFEDAQAYLYKVATGGN